MIVLLAGLGLLLLFIIGLGILFGAPFVPTRKIWIDDAMKLAKVGEGDVVVDLGSGDGAVLKRALECGARRVVGYEINPLLAWWSRVRLWRFRRARDTVVIQNKDLFRGSLPPDTTVVYLFQIDRVLKKIPDFLEKQLPNLRTKRLRVVAFGFSLPDRQPLRTRRGMSLYEFRR